MNPIYFAAIVLLIIILSIGYSIYEKAKVKKSIKNLWPENKSLFRGDNPYVKYNQYFLNKKEHVEFYVDQITWKDLSLDTIFRRINYTFSSVGDQYLYAALRNVQHEHTIQEQLIGKIEQDQSFRNRLSSILATLGRSDNNDSSKYIFQKDKMVQYAPYNKLYILLSLIPLISIGAFFINPYIGIFGILASLTLNISKSTLFLSSHKQHFNDLFYAIKVIDSSNEIDRLTKNHYKQLNNIKGIKLLSYFMVDDNYNEGNIGIVMMNAIKQAFILDYHLYHYLTSQLSQSKDEYEYHWLNVATHDLNYSVALWRKQLDTYSIPTHDSEHLIIKNGIHPLLQNPVPNNFTFDNSVLLTGSNASGKSTFMKMIATNIILSEGLHTSLSESMSYPKGAVFTSMNLADSIEDGDSYFISEVKSIREIIDDISSVKKAYIFIDEILRGTNTIERISSAQAILSYFHEQPHVTLCAATHDIELTELLNDKFQFYYFKEHLTEQNEVKFDYKIRQGITNTSNAIELMRIHDFPQSVYKQAKDNLLNIKSLNTTSTNRYNS